jgi:hypothetical protein
LPAGFLTNFDTLFSTIKQMNEKKAFIASENFSKLTKKEQKKEPFSALQYFFGLLFVASEFAFDTFQKISPDFFLDLQDNIKYSNADQAKHRLIDAKADVQVDREIDQAGANKPPKANLAPLKK